MFQRRVIIIAALADHRQHQNLPETHAAATPSDTSRTQHVRRHQLKNLITSRGVRLEMLKPRQNRDQLESRSSVQMNLIDGRLPK